MDIAAAVDAERLREIIAELVNRTAAVVERYGGTVHQITGDGIMAMFGAPMALEDDAIGPALRVWASKIIASVWLSRLQAATVSTCGCGLA